MHKLALDGTSARLMYAGSCSRHATIGPALGLALILGAGLGAGAWPAAGAAQQVGKTVIVREAQTRDFYAAGREVEVRAPVEGDVVVAGRNVTISGSVSEDVVAAGQRVTVSGAVADDVRLAGRSVSVAGEVAGHAALAGAEVRIEPGSRIGDWAWLAGGRVYVAGRVGGNLKAAGGTLELTGEVDGDVELVGSRIEIGEGAVIGGNLTWRSKREPVIRDGATIGGEVIAGPPLPERPRRGGGFAFRLFTVISVIAAAGLLYTLFRPQCAAVAATLGTRPWASLVTGLVVLATTPVALVLVFATGVGWLLGLILGLGYGLALLLGSLLGLVAIAQLGAARLSRAPVPGPVAVWLAITIVATVMGLLYGVRPLGALAGTLVMLSGLGALSLAAYGRYRA